MNLLRTDDRIEERQGESNETMFCDKRGRAFKNDPDIMKRALPFCLKRKLCNGC